MDLIRKSNLKLKPYYNLERHPCPFYGFDGRFEMLREGEKDQCGLIVEPCIYCRMLLYKEIPNWDRCIFNTEESKNKLVGILANMRIFPNEFKPQEESELKSWRGIEFAEWVDYIMKRR